MGRIGSNVQPSLKSATHAGRLRPSRSPTTWAVSGGLVVTRQSNGCDAIKDLVARSAVGSQDTTRASGTRDLGEEIGRRGCKISARVFADRGASSKRPPEQPRRPQVTGPHDTFTCVGTRRAGRIGCHDRHVVPHVHEVTGHRSPPIAPRAGKRRVMVGDDENASSCRALGHVVSDVSSDLSESSTFVALQIPTGSRHRSERASAATTLVSTSAVVRVDRSSCVSAILVTQRSSASHVLEVVLGDSAQHPEPIRAVAEDFHPQLRIGFGASRKAETRAVTRFSGTWRPANTIDRSAPKS